MTTEYDAAYRRTSYWVEAPHEWIRLRVDATSEALERFLAARREKCWAFVTADNPGSRPVPPAENALRRADLREAIEGLNRICFPGVSVGDDGTWPPELGFFVLGIEREAALALGRRFGQNAILFGTRGKPVQLLACDAD